MRVILRGLGIAVVVLAVLPLLAAQEVGKKKSDAKKGDEDVAAEKAEKSTKKKTKSAKKKEGDEEPEKKKEKLTYGVHFTGKLKMDANSQKEFIVEVQATVLNPQGVQNLYNAQANWQRRQIEIARNRNLVQRQQQLAQLQFDIARELPKLQAGCYKQQPYDVKLKAADKMIVRTRYPPIDYDDKGNIKKYTKKELQELRGPDKSLPGFTADFEALHDGQMVTVYLAKKEANPVPNAKKKYGKKPPAKLNPDDDAGDLGDHRPEVVLIVIEAEPKRD
jgi:hypothetical protein